MENNTPRRRPVYDRPPSRKGFARAIWFSMIFVVAYGGFLIWKNYYAPGAEPPIQRKQLAVPQEMLDSSATGDTK
jgi:hypothetical protein